MRHQPRKHLLAYALSLLSANVLIGGFAHAQNTADNKAVNTLDNVVVTASGFAQAVQDAPASISVITREQLDSKFYRDVHDALQDAPGVIVTGGGDKQDISLRGMGSQYTLILIDGKRQSSRETRTNSDSGGVEGGWTPPIGAIERIEIVRGPMSSLYGSDAIGGVINIITRKVPETWGGEIRADTTLQGSSDSGNLYQGNFYLAGPLKTDLLGLQIYGQYTDRKEDDIFNGYRGRKADNVTAKLVLTPNKDHDITLEGGTQRQRYASTLGKTVAPEAPPCGRFGCPESSTTEYRNTNVSLSHTGRWGIGTSDTWIKREVFDNKSREMKIKNTDFLSTLAAPVGDTHMLSVGFAYSHQSLDDKTGNQLTTGISDISRYNWALFAEDEWQIVDQFALTAGVRMDKDENFGNHFSPRLYGVWNPTGNWTVKGGVSTGFRAPDLRQTIPGWGQVSRGGNMYGNPDLKPEKSINYEMGVHYSLDSGFQAGATVFYNDFKDKITRVACPLTQCTDGKNSFGSDPTTYLNVDKAITQGIELSMTWPITDHWSLTGNYTFTDSEQKSGENKGQPLNKLPRHLLHTTLNFKPNQQFSSWLRVNYRGRESQPVTSASSSTTRAPSYTFIDLGGTYHVTKAVSVYAGVYNLLNKKVDYDDYGYVEDGRRYWLGVGVKF